MSTSNIKNRAGATFIRAMSHIDKLHKEIDRKARKGRYNEEVFKIKIASNRARVWSF